MEPHHGTSLHPTRRALSAIATVLAAALITVAAFGAPATALGEVEDLEVIQLEGQPSVARANTDVPPSGATAPGAGYEFEDFLKYTGVNFSFLVGAFIKDWGEGKTWLNSWAGKAGNKRFSDSKKYMTIFAGSVALGLAAAFIPDPMDQFREDIVDHMNVAIERLDGVIEHIEEILTLTDEANAALTELTFTVLGQLFVETASIVEVYFYEVYDLLESVTNVNGGDQPPDADDVAWLESEFERVFFGIYKDIRGTYEALKLQSLSALAHDGAALDKMFAETAGAESVYYEALWASALYANSMVEQAAGLMYEFNLYMATAYPQDEEEYLAAADGYMQDLRRHQSTVMGMLRLPAGNDNVDVIARPDGWTLYVNDGWDDRREWYDCGCGLEPVLIEDDEFNQFGRPANVSPLVQVTTLSEGDSSVTVYRDGVAVYSLEESDTFMPGPDAEQIMLTTDRTAIPTSGWALLAEPDPDESFLGWSGDAESGVATTQLDLVVDDWNFVVAGFGTAYSTVDVLVDGPGTVEVFEYGEQIATVHLDDVSDGDPIWVVGETTDIDVVLTSDANVAVEQSHALAFLVDDAYITSWSPSLAGPEHVVTLAPGDVLELDTQTTAEEPGWLDLTVDGAGEIVVYHHGVEQLRHGSATAQRVPIEPGEVTIVADPTDLPADGWAILADAGLGEFLGWSGDHSGTAEAVLTLESGSITALVASFFHDAQTVHVDIDGPGTVELLIDGQRVHTFDSDGNLPLGETFDTATLVGTAADLPESGLAIVARPGDGVWDRFHGWSGDGSGRSTTVALEAGEHLRVTASFDDEGTYTYTPAGYFGGVWGEDMSAAPLVLTVQGGVAQTTSEHIATIDGWFGWSEMPGQPTTATVLVETLSMRFADDGSLADGTIAGVADETWGGNVMFGALDATHDTMSGHLQLVVDDAYDHTAYYGFDFDPTDPKWALRAALDNVPDAPLPATAMLEEDAEAPQTEEIQDHHDAPTAASSVVAPGALEIANDGPGTVEIYEDGALIATIECYQTEVVTPARHHSTVTRVTDANSVGASGLFVLSVAQRGMFEALDWTGDDVVGDTAALTAGEVSSVIVRHGLTTSSGFRSQGSHLGGTPDIFCPRISSDTNSHNARGGAIGSGHSHLTRWQNPLHGNCHGDKLSGIGVSFDLDRDGNAFNFEFGHPRIEYEDSGWYDIIDVKSSGLDLDTGVIHLEFHSWRGLEAVVAMA